MVKAGLQQKFKSNSVNFAKRVVTFGVLLHGNKHNVFVHFAELHTGFSIR